MVKKMIKVTGIVLSCLVIIGTLFYVKVYISTEARIHKVYHNDPEEITLPTDTAALALGSRLATSKGCIGCHGQDLGGKVYMNAPSTIGFIIAKNITPGKGGLPPDYQTKDWVRALKHGVNRDNKSLWAMPSYEFAQLTKSDMAALIAFCSQVPAVDREFPTNHIAPLGRIMVDLYDEVPLLSAEMIDHNQPFVEEVKPSLTLEYGKYLAISCAGCHRENMKGGDPIAPSFPPVADITSTGNPGQWTEEQFMTTLRTGKTPEGKHVHAAVSWQSFAAYTSMELKALRLYLNSL